MLNKLRSASSRWVRVERMSDYQNGGSIREWAKIIILPAPPEPPYDIVEAVMRRLKVTK